MLMAEVPIQTYFAIYFNDGLNGLGLAVEDQAHSKLRSTPLRAKADPEKSGTLRAIGSVWIRKFAGGCMGMRCKQANIYRQKLFRMFGNSKAQNQPITTGQVPAISSAVCEDMQLF
jgi:hypothetical protein